MSWRYSWVSLLFILQGFFYKMLVLLIFKWYFGLFPSNKTEMNHLSLKEDILSF